MNIESEVTSRIEDVIDDEIDPMESIEEREDFDFDTDSKVSDFHPMASFGRGDLNPPIALQNLDHSGSGDHSNKPVLRQNSFSVEGMFANQKQSAEAFNMDEYLLNSSQERDRRNTFNDMNGRRQSSLFKDNY